MVITAAALITSVMIRFGSLNVFPLTEYLGTFLFLFVGYFSTALVENLYSIRVTLNRSMLLYRSMRTVFLVTGAYILFIFILKGARGIVINSRMVTVMNMFIFLTYSLLARMLILPGFFKWLYNGRRRSRILIIGNPEKNQSVAGFLMKSIVYSGGKELALCSEKLPEDSGKAADTVLTKVAEKECDGAIVLFDSSHTMNCIAETCVTLNDKDIPFVIYGPEVFSLGYFDPWFSLDDYGAITFILKGRNKAPSRVLDIILSLAALTVLSPLMAAVALGIKLTSKGPLIFRQERVGFEEKHFNFLKFRSMKVGNTNTKAHREYFRNYAKGESAGQEKETFKLNQTSRVTTIGRIIRKTSIDELPQFINVLKGEMTIVGPRPCIPYELEHYRGWQRRRFQVKPGLTGIWQVYGRSRLPFDKSQFLDFLYTIDATCALDFRLIMKTVPVMFFGKGGL